MHQVLMEINLFGSILAFAFAAWACHSKHVRDGIIIKLGLAGFGIGMASSARSAWLYAQPWGLHTQVWLLGSMAVIIIGIIVRVIVAKLKNERPVFITY